LSTGRKRIIIGAVVFLGVVIVVFAYNFGQMIREIGRVMDAPLAQHDLSLVADGAYPGETTYMGSAFEVEVKVKDHRVTGIDVLKDDGREYSKKAAAVLVNVIEKQSLEVDAVSGATTTSKVLLNAVNDALLRARQSPIPAEEETAPRRE
jgi:uncharacterized protein with FMN-binding domain